MSTQTPTQREAIRDLYGSLSVALSLLRNLSKLETIPPHWMSEIEGARDDAEATLTANVRFEREDAEAAILD